MRVNALEVFADRSLPVLVDMRISSYLAEFLSIPDRQRLIEIDNKRMKELHDYATSKAHALEQQVMFENQSLSQIHAAITKEKPDEDNPKEIEKDKIIANLSKRLDTLFKGLLEKKQGYGTFRYGLDWHRYMDPRQVADASKYLKNIELSSKKLERDLGELADTERLLKEHRLKLMSDMGFKNFALDDFTLRKPEELVDNPFMRFIGYSHPVRVYKQVTLVKERVVHIFKSNATAERLEKRRMTAKSSKSRQKRKKSEDSSGSFEADGIFEKLLRAHHLLDQQKAIVGGQTLLDPKALLIQDSSDGKDEDGSNYNIYAGGISSGEEDDAGEDDNFIE